MRRNPGEIEIPKRRAAAVRAVLLGIACLLLFPACNANRELAERAQPSFDQTEASALVGERVRSKREYDPSLDSKVTTRIAAAIFSKTGLGMDYINAPTVKFPQQGGPCSRVAKGDCGTVSGFVPVPDGGYFLVVRWDDPTGGPELISYCGRAAYRVFLEPI
jgi:hypothetical protein